MLVMSWRECAIFRRKEIIKVCSLPILPVKAGIAFADIPDLERGGAELSVEGNPILPEKILIDPVQYLDWALAWSCNKVITQMMRSQIKQSFRLGAP